MLEYTEEFKKYVFDCISGLSDVLYVDGYEFRVVFNDSQPAGDMLMYADILVGSTYLEATINVYPSCFSMWEDGNRERIAHILLHELCHIHTDSLYSWARDDARPSQKDFIIEENENLVERMARVVSGLLPDDWWDKVALGFSRREYVKIREKSKDSSEFAKEQDFFRDSSSRRR